MTIDEACCKGDAETARRLFQAYAASLPFSLDFQNFQNLAFLSWASVPVEGWVRESVWLPAHWMNHWEVERKFPPDKNSQNLLACPSI